MNNLLKQQPLLKTSGLFDPFPPEMGTDTAFLDRMHCYIPGWEIPKFRPELMSAFQLIPYQSAEDAVFKALGVE